MASDSILSYANANATRNLPVQDPLWEAIERSLEEVYGAGYRADIISGGQGDGSNGITGSRRHTTGGAADVYVYGPDGKLSPDELVSLGQYWQTNNLGGVGFPANGQSMHLDIIGGQGPGSIPLGQGEGMLWYYGQPTAAQRAGLGQPWAGPATPAAAINAAAPTQPIMRPAGNVQQPRRGNFWGNIAGAVTSRLPAPMSAGMSRVADALMSSANPMATVAGRTAVIDGALKNVFTGSPAGHSPTSAVRAQANTGMSPSQAYDAANRAASDRAIANAAPQYRDPDALWRRL